MPRLFRLIACVLTLLAPAAAAEPPPVALSEAAGLLDRLGYGTEAPEEWLPGRTWTAPRHPVALTADRRAMLLEELAAVLLEGVAAAEIARADAEAVRPALDRVGSWNRRILAVWKRQFAPVVKEVAADHGLAFPDDRSAMPADPLETVKNPDGGVARQAWKACRMRHAQADALAHDAMARLRRANLRAAPAAIDAVETELRVILDAVMDEIETKQVNALAALVPAEDLTRLAAWCAGPVGATLASAPRAVVAPVLTRWTRTIR